MSNQPIPISRVGGADDADAGFEARALQPGALSAKGDDWKFTGDGVITPTQVLGRIIEVEAKENRDLSVFVGNRDAARFAAQENLRRYNHHLGETDPNKPVPRGEQFFAHGGPSLKDLLAPYAKNLDKLRAMVEASSVALGEGENKAIGAVRRNAASIRGLPTDPKL